MNTATDWETTLAPLAQNLLQAGIGLWVQSALLLLLALALGRLANRLGPLVASLVYKSALVGVVCLLILSVSVAQGFPALWHISLPTVTLSASVVRPATLQTPSVVPLREEDTFVPVPTSPAPREETRTVDSGNATAVPVAEKPSFAPPMPAPAPVPVPHWGWGRLYMALAALWCVGTLLQSLWFLACLISLLLIRQQSSPIAEPAIDALCSELCAKLRVSRPLLFAHPGIPGPFLSGLWRPAIFLPSATLKMDSEALRAILAHELVHLARRDQFWSLLARIVCTMGWSQPLLWLLSQHLEETSETICDRAVLEMDCSPRAYANCLLHLAERFRSRRLSRSIGVTMLPSRSSLGRRIQTILNPSLRQNARPVNTSHRAAAIVGLACTLALCLTLVSTQATSSGHHQAASPAPGGQQSQQGTVSLDQRTAAQQGKTTDAAQRAQLAETAIRARELQARVAEARALVLLKRMMAENQHLKAILRARFAQEAELKAARQAEQMEYLKRRQAELLQELAGLRTKYADQHPQIVQERAKLETIEQQIAVEQASVAQGQAQAQVAEANVHSVRANLDAAQAKYSRVHALNKQGFVPPHDVDIAQAEVAQAQAMVQQAQAQLAQAQAEVAQKQDLLNQQRLNLQILQKSLRDKAEKIRQEDARVSRQKQTPAHRKAPPKGTTQSSAPYHVIPFTVGHQNGAGNSDTLTFGFTVQDPAHIRAKQTLTYVVQFFDRDVNGKIESGKRIGEQTFEIPILSDLPGAHTQTFPEAEHRKDLFKRQESILGPQSIYGIRSFYKYTITLTDNSLGFEKQFSASRGETWISGFRIGNTSVYGSGPKRIIRSITAMQHHPFGNAHSESRVPVPGVPIPVDDFFARDIKTLEPTRSGNSTL